MIVREVWVYKKFNWLKAVTAFHTLPFWTLLFQYFELVNWMALLYYRLFNVHVRMGMHPVLVNILICHWGETILVLDIPTKFSKRVTIWLVSLPPLSRHPFYLYSFCLVVCYKRQFCLILTGLRNFSHSKRVVLFY